MTLLASHSRAARAASLPLGPGLAQRLAERGTDHRRGEGEDAESHRSRMETGLMALFRESREGEVFGALYEHSLESVQRAIGAALRGLPHGTDQAELVQDVYVNVYRYAGSFRDEHPRSFRSWISTICANVVRRNLSHRPRTLLLELPERMQEPADTRRGPVDLALCGEEYRHLSSAWFLLLLHYAAAWRELGPRDRLALELVEVQGLSYSDACRRLGVGMSNMKMIMFRARKRIRAGIARAMGSGGLESHRLAS